MCKTILQKVKFRAPPKVIYTLLVDAKSHQAVTGQKAKNDEAVGGRFASYNGRVVGINVELVPGRRVVRAWQERQFADGIFSMATINLTATPDGGTQLSLTHRGVPKDLIPRIEAEWRELYWDKIREYLKSASTTSQAPTKQRRS